MSISRRRFTQEFRDELCREVISTSKPIQDVATAYGVGPETLRKANGGTETELTVSERARLKELEREKVAFPVPDRLLGDLLTADCVGDRDRTLQHGQHNAELLFRGDRGWTTHDIQTFELGRCISNQLPLPNSQTSDTLSRREN